jgi:hypothetical protein
VKGHLEMEQQMGCFVVLFIGKSVWKKVEDIKVSDVEAMLFGTDYKGSQFRMEEQTEQGKMLLCEWTWQQFVLELEGGMNNDCYDLWGPCIYRRLMRDEYWKIEDH